MSFRLVLFVSLTVLLGCKSRSYSETKGHFEAGTQQQLDAVKNKIRVAPEWAPAESVIIGESILNSGSSLDLIRKILSTGVKGVILYRGPKFSFPGSVDQVQKAVAQVNDPRLKVLEKTDAVFMTQWARDWGPFSAFNTNSGERILLDMNYFTVQKDDDFFPQLFANSRSLRRVSVPLYLQGGNFMINDRGHCISSDVVVLENSKKHRPDDTVLSRSDVENVYKTVFGCTKVIITTSMPFEATRHVDMWAKWLNDNTLIVAQVQNEAIALIKKDNDKKRSLQIQAFLENRAREFVAMGYFVKRVPMLIPTFDVPGDGSSPTAFAPYTNSLIVNGNVLVPRYKGSIDFFRSADSSLIPAYEKQVQAVYAEGGFPVDKFHWFDADDTIAARGMIHCSTMGIAAKIK